MRVIGVLDVLNGRAVHARGGTRERYTPVDTVAGAAIASGDPLALARVYVDRFGLAEIYAADLDAILGRPPQDTLVTDLAAACGVPLWVDAGVSGADRARRLLDAGVAQVVLGLETLPSFAALGEICAAVGANHTAFSLDLRNGEPIVAPDSACISEPPEQVAARAADAGANAVIVLDLARVGSGTGVDVGLFSRIRRVVPRVALLSGGGVRDIDDLARLSDAGCDGALVATALLDGRLDPHAITRAHQS